MVLKVNKLEKEKFSIDVPKDLLQNLTKEEQEAIKKLNSIKEFKKGTVLISEGQFFRESYFVISGMLRQFCLVDGDENTSNFYTANQSVFSSVAAFENQASPFTIICQEDSTVSVVSFEKEKELCKRFPRFDQMCRITTERELSEYNQKFAKFISATPEQRYVNLVNERPELIERVPQYHLSSYLGMKPESLSRIRKRLATR